MYTTYLFDFDYTLADAGEGIVLCFHLTFDALGHKRASDEEIRKTIGWTLGEAYTHLTGITDHERILQFRKIYRAFADVHMTEHTQLLPETIPVLTELKRRGKKLGVVTTKYRYRICEAVEKFSLHGLFDCIVGGEDVSAAKPDPEGLNLICEKLGVKKSEVLYIGDCDVDAIAAERAGIDFAGVTTGTTTHEEFAQYPHRKIMSNLTELL
ncbi:MAG: HAD-IA family hydrolase [Oscillospiraceae bacterium]|nr:HAD-IA family hydrolase [Oscillospiraceae bacterium]